MSESAKLIVHERPPQSPAPLQKRRLVEAMAEKYGVDPDKMLTTLKQTCFQQKGGPEVTTEQMMMLLVVANEYNLNPFTREIYAFPSRNGIVPIVSIDGWIRIVNEHPAYNGVSFEYGPPDGDAKHRGAPAWIQCTLLRKDREAQVCIREYLHECYRNTEPWNTTTSRMLRHRAFIQAGRVAFGFALHDEDEAQRIVEGESTRVPERSTAIGKINAEVSGTTIDGESTHEREAESAGPGETFASIMDRVEKLTPAATASDIELCRDLTRSLKNETQEGEINARIDARLKEFAAKAVSKEKA